MCVQLYYNPNVKAFVYKSASWSWSCGSCIYNHD